MLRRVLSKIAYPFLVFVPPALTIRGMEQHWAERFISDPTLSRAALYAAIAVPFTLAIAVLERKMPLKSRWNGRFNDVPTDVAHMISVSAVVNIVAVLLSGVGAALEAELAALAGGKVWPSHWPLGQQLLLAVLVGGFLPYWGHRLDHELPLLWRLHAVHHTAPRLYWLNANRFHVLDIALLNTVQALPLIVLGATPEVFFLYSMLTLLMGFLQHCNVGFDTGFLSYVFNTNFLHQWHHSPLPSHNNANYGGTLLIWDHLFGTFSHPGKRELALELGIDEPAPQTYLAQQLAAFRPKTFASGRPVLAPTVPHEHESMRDREARVSRALCDDPKIAASEATLP